MSNRSAIDTIKGYFYQFDYSIEKLLNLPCDSDEIIVENVEDVDIVSTTETTAVQCKYYSKTEYNHSVISKPIRLMLTHFKKIKEDGKIPHIKYHLYGHYKSGQSKLSLPIDESFLKDKLLTYRIGGVQKKHHDELGLDNNDLNKFLSLLSIDINAKEYFEQYIGIITSLKSIFSCDDFNAEYYFYNNALNEIRKIVIEGNVNKRNVSKGEFLERIDQKQILFNTWFIELKGRQQYNKALKDKFFRTLNKSPFERFFLIDLPDNCNVGTLKELVLLISKRFSNLKKREPQTYCPYIYFNNLDDVRLLILKNQLFSEGVKFIDGFPFSGASFSVDHITAKADFNNKVKAKILDETEQINDTLTSITKTREVYQFYFDKPFYSTLDPSVKNVDIQINDLGNIQEII